VDRIFYISQPITIDVRGRVAKMFIYFSLSSLSHKQKNSAQSKGDFAVDMEEDQLGCEEFPSPALF
jgi:hypothetical protein